MRKALIVVDVQRDFCDGGALPAVDAASLIKPLENCIAEVRRGAALIVFTQDWHPPDHISFNTNGGPWPVHCIAGSVGAELMPPLVAEDSDLVVQTGVTHDALGYSAFEFTDLGNRLRAFGVESLAVCGIATEYCVRATALDAAKGGWTTTLLSDLVRAIQPAATTAVLDELVHEGIGIARAEAWLKSA